MKFSHSNTFPSAVLIFALLSHVLSTQTSESDDTTTITLDQTIDFIGTGGAVMWSKTLWGIPLRGRRNGFGSLPEPNAGMNWRGIFFDLPHIPQ